MIEKGLVCEEFYISRDLFVNSEGLGVISWTFGNWFVKILWCQGLFYKFLGWNCRASLLEDLVYEASFLLSFSAFRPSGNDLELWNLGFGLRNARQALEFMTSDLGFGIFIFRFGFQKSGFWVSSIIMQKLILGF